MVFEPTCMPHMEETTVPKTITCTFATAFSGPESLLRSQTLCTDGCTFDVHWGIAAG